jgi:inhibitor of cysteine peptidase
MSRSLLFLGMALLLASLSACARAAPHRVQVTEQDNGKTVTIARGGSLEITLGGNPTTGYLWVLEEGDDSILKSQGDYIFKSDSTLVGSGGKFTYAFKAAEHGQATLTLVYRRPWEQRAPSDKSFSITVSVE